MSLNNILKTLQSFVCREFSDSELIDIQKMLSEHSNEEILLASIASMPSKKEMMTMPLENSNEPLIPLENSSHLLLQPSKLSRLACWDNIFVRASVHQKLIHVAERLRNHHIGLIVKCGYRSPQVQSEAFKNALHLAQEKCAHLSEDIIYGYAHLSVADPEVAAHPTGGAVDVSLFDLKTRRELDFWGGDFPNGSLKNLSLLFMNWRGLELEQIKNRLLLAKSMVLSWFWLFPGEFWHYSIGDVEASVALGHHAAMYEILATYQ